MDDGAWGQWVGRKGEIVPGPYPVSVATIGYLAEALEDERLAGLLSDPSLNAPRSFVTIASRVPNWRPSSATGPQSFMQAMSIPMNATSGVNLGIDQKYYAPLRPGDSLTSQSTIQSIVPKTTKLGEGFIIVELIEHRTETGTLVATTENTLLRFAPGPKKGDGDAPRPALQDAAPGAMPAPQSDFPLATIPITMTVLAKAAGAVRDYAPLHHDIDQARAAGHATAFLSYSHQMAIIIKAIGDWFGTDERMRRLKLAMKKPIYLDTTCVVSGIRKLSEDPQIEIIEVSLSTENGLSTTGTVELHNGEGDLWS